MNTIRILEKRAYLIKELTEGYKASKRDTQLTEDWDATSGDGID